jgi:hypothetical protein
MSVDAIPVWAVFAMTIFAVIISAEEAFTFWAERIRVLMDQAHDANLKEK